MLTLFDEEIVVWGDVYRFAGDADKAGRVYFELLTSSGEWRRHEMSEERWRDFVRRYGNHADVV